MRSWMGGDKNPHAISRSAQLALALVVALASSSCDRKSAPEQERNRISQPVSDQKGRRVLEVSNSDAGTQIAQRLMERERAASLRPGADAPDTLMAEYAGANADRKAEILSLLGAEGSSDAWEFLCQAASDQNQVIRLAALDALAVHGGGDPSQVISSCLSFPDEETRALAATLLGRRVRDAEVWAKAATDPSPVVRITYLSAVETAPNQIKIAAASRALASGNPQFRLEAASILGSTKTKEAVELLVPLLDGPQLSDVAGEGLFFFFSRPFGSAAEAREWLNQQGDDIWQ